MTEFVFGTLSTKESRVNVLEEARRGVKHLHSIDPLAPGPGDAPLLSVIIGLDKTIEHVLCRVSEPTAVVYPMQVVKTNWDILKWAYYQVWQVQLPAQPAGTVVRYTIEAHPQDGSAPITADDGAIFSYLVDDPSPPAWSAEAVIYQIFPDRFHPGSGRSWNEPDTLDGIFGGTIQGIIDHLDYIAELGFNCIWLNPFFPDTTYHGYHATDYFSVNPRLGTDEDIHALVKQAHDKGIRLILDFVANHWGSNHPTFKAAQKDQNSEYYHWYRWENWPDEYATFFKVKDLPQINVDFPPAREHLLAAARYWLEAFDFDGYRLDYALGPSHDFWTDFRGAVSRAKPDAWIFGEVVETPTVLRSYWGKLHGCLDFTLQHALRHTFAFGDMSLAAFDAFLNQNETFFPAAFSRPSFLENHDVNRFLWLVGGDKRKLKLASLCQFTLSGQPIVYYGSEVGLGQEQDMIRPNGSHNMAEARLPMLWDDEQDGDLREYFHWLVHFRRQHPALWQGDFKTLHLDEKAGTYAYERSDNRETIIVALNLSQAERVINIDDHIFKLAPWGGDVQVVSNPWARIIP